MFFLIAVCENLQKNEAIDSVALYGKGRNNTDFPQFHLANLTVLFVLLLIKVIVELHINLKNIEYGKTSSIFEPECGNACDKADGSCYPSQMWRDARQATELYNITCYCRTSCWHAYCTGLDLLWFLYPFLTRPLPKIKNVHAKLNTSMHIRVFPKLHKVGNVASEIF